MTAGAVLGYLAIRNTRPPQASDPLVAAGEQQSKAQSGRHNEVPDDEVRHHKHLHSTDSFSCIRYDNLFHTSFPFSMGVHGEHHSLISIIFFPRLTSLGTQVLPVDVRTDTGSCTCTTTRLSCGRRPSKSLWSVTNYWPNHSAT